jgi:hypothetical protein
MLPASARTRWTSPNWLEHGQRIIAGAAEMAIIGTAFLLAIGRALARIHVEHDDLRRLPLVHLSIHRLGSSASAARFSGRLSHFVSKRPIWPAEAAEPAIARSPATQRIAGSPHSFLGVVHVLIGGQPPEHRLAEQPSPAGGDRSCRCARRLAYRHPCRSGALALGRVENCAPGGPPQRSLTT